MFLRLTSEGDDLPVGIAKMYKTDIDMGVESDWYAECRPTEIREGVGERRFPDTTYRRVDRSSVDLTTRCRSTDTI